MLLQNCGGCTKTCGYDEIVIDDACNVGHHDFKRMCPCGIIPTAAPSPSSQPCNAVRVIHAMCESKSERANKREHMNRLRWCNWLMFFDIKKQVSSSS